MTEPPRDPEDASPRRRRVRYVGTHPRGFKERYKERDPERYPELSEHVRQKGRTPAGQHVSVLPDETLAALRPVAGERAVDGTLGYGGHAERLLATLAPDGQLLALDADPIELPRTEARLRAAGHDERALIVRRCNFAGLVAALHGVGWADGVDAVLLDLGVSSMQIDDPSRGFSVGADGPLDMRMNPARGASAAQWLERVKRSSLVAALDDNADEPWRQEVADALCEARDAGHGVPQTTAELAEIVRTALPASCSDDERALSVRRVFQALRIAVNEEFTALETTLRDLPSCLRAGGRAAIISFHSGEDRRVKRAFKQGFADGTWSEISPTVIRASARERVENPRSTSAKLRWAVRA